MIARFTLALAIPVLCAAQNAQNITGVQTNQRSGSDDPRTGLKAGLYDAGEAAFGMQKLISMPKPPGFAPNPDGSVEAFPGGPEPPPPADARDGANPRPEIGRAHV